MCVINVESWWCPDDDVNDKGDENDGYHYDDSNDDEEDDKENDKDDGEEFINDGTKHNDCTKPTGLPPASWDS